MVMLILKSFVIPVLAGAGTIALCWMLPPIRKWTWLANSAFGFAIGVAALVAWLAGDGIPTFPPTEMKQWVGILALLALIYAGVAAATGRREYPLLPIVALIAGGLVAFSPYISVMLGGKREIMFADMTVGDHLAIGLAIALGLLIFDQVAERRPGATMPLVFGVCFGAMAGFANGAGWITLTFLCAAACATCFVAALVGRFAGAPSIGRGGVLAAILLLAVCPVAIYRQTHHEFEWWMLMLAGGAPIVLLCFENRLLDKAPPWLATTIRVGSVAIVVGIGLYYGLGTIEAGDADADPMLMYQ